MPELDADFENKAVPVEECEVDVFDPEKVAKLQGRTEDISGVYELFRILGDDTRTRIAYLLSLEELCVHDLAALLGMSSSAVSHHLRLLRNVRLVRSRREGKIVYYSLDDAHVIRLIEVAQEHYRERFPAPRTSQ